MDHMPATPSPPADRPLRRDAERNRRLILDAAAEAFADEGLQVTLDAIAARAGVGVGTVYRRFPDKESLIDALFEERIAEVGALAEQALAEEDAWAGFVCWFEGLAAMQAADRGLKEVLITRAHGRDRVSSARERLLPMVTKIVARAQAAGELRPDVSPTDMPGLGFMVGGVADYTRCVSPDVWRRYAVIVLDGLRVRRERPTELPAPPLGIEEVDTIMRAKGT
jgi:AcrR family transcriptional regulator